MLRSVQLKSSTQGFSLVEVSIIITILGLLAMVAIPKIRNFKARTFQSEAKAGLSGIHLAMQAYYATYGDFPDIPAGTDATDSAMAPIGFKLQGPKVTYRYSIHSVSGKDGKPGYWAAGATSLKEMNESSVGELYDNLRLNSSRWMCAPFDGISGKSATKPIFSGPSKTTDCPEQTMGTKSWSVTLTVADKAD